VCLNTCAAAQCGDGVIQSGVDQCDDGNVVNTDGCLNTCVTARCGDGVLRAGLETCDDGNTNNTDACLNTCVPARCGDGVVQAGSEQCDDGNTSNTDGCLNTCRTAYCGDSFVRAGAEQCDDGNLANTDDCLDTCLVAACGDGFLRTGVEACDDANQSNTDACLNTCVAARCGDGVLQAGVEGCEDGNNQSDDGCSPLCGTEEGHFFETEPNNSQAMTNGPVNVPVIVHGATAAGGDRDYVAFIIPAVADVRLETSDAVGPPSCEGIDTVLDLIGPEGAIRASNDNVGDGRCSLLDPSTGPGTERLAPGTYYARITSNSDSPASTYQLFITFTALCGDGFRTNSETCDDGNAVAGDGCDTSCIAEPGHTFEYGNNDSPATATVLGVPTATAHAGIGPRSPADQDYFRFSVPVTSDVRIETFGATGQPSCGIDTVVQLFGPDGVTQLSINDDGGIPNCSLIDPLSASFPGARGLPPGNYFVRVTSYAQVSLIPAYQLRITLAAQCGNGAREGSEVCDDGNLEAGDGCSPECRAEPRHIFESGPNESAGGSQLVGTPNVTVHAAINGGADEDYFQFFVPNYADVVIQTFDATGVTCAGVDTVISLLTDAAEEFAFNDNGGIPNCSRLDKTSFPILGGLYPGVYYVRVASSAQQPIPAYTLKISFVELCGDGIREGAETCDDGNAASSDGCTSYCALEPGHLFETEPNDTTSGASNLGTAAVTAHGAISTPADQDFFRITLTTVTDLKLETFDATGAPNCNSIDTLLALQFAGDDTVIAADDDLGVNRCSLLDPAGNPALRALSPGEYDVRVTAFGNASTIPGYRLVVSFAATCGNGQREGSEVCDDGNLNNGDGCSRVCRAEAGHFFERESNGTAGTADAVGVPRVTIHGAINPGTDQDWFRFTLNGTTDVMLQTFDAGGTACAGIDTIVTLYRADGSTVIASNDDGGLPRCSLIDPAGVPAVRLLAAGTYYARVTSYVNTVIDGYVLRITTPNSPPHASLTATPNFGKFPLTVTLNASGSYDLDGTIPLYMWDFNGDGMDDDGSLLPTITHVYTGAGRFDPRVTVYDSASPPSTASASASVRVISGGWRTVYLGPSSSELPQTVVGEVNGRISVAVCDTPYLEFTQALDVDGNAFSPRRPVFNNARLPGGLVSLPGNVPGIAYRNYDDGGVSFIRATGPSGQTWGAPVPVGPDVEGGSGSLKMGVALVNGYPAVAYGPRRFQYVGATSLSGDTWGTPVVVGSLFNHSQPVSLVMVNFRPAMVFSNSDSAWSTVFARATAADGSTWGPSAGVGEDMYQSVLHVVNGRPAIVSVDARSVVQFVLANDADGTSWGPTQVVFNGGSSRFVSNPVMAVFNGVPVVAFQGPLDELMYTEALDPEGSAWAPHVEVAAYGTNPALAIVNGLPAISYGIPYGNWVAVMH